MTTPPPPSGDRDVDSQIEKIGGEFSEGKYPPPASKPDKRTRRALKKEEDFVDRARDLDLQDRKNDINARKTFGKWAFFLVVAWLFAVLIIVWMSGVTMSGPGWHPDWLPWIVSFKLSDTVLVTLLGTATVNVLGLLVIIFNYLYPSRKKP